MNGFPSHAFDAKAKTASGPNGTRLQQLSDEVGRIASTLARLATTPELRAVPCEKVTPEISPEIVRAVICARRLREKFFSADLFADPVWDMLLDLFHAQLSGFRVSVSSLCIAAAVPATTALRWLKIMTDKGLVIRHADPFDGRRMFVELSPQASLALQSYFSDIGKIRII